MLTNHCQTVSSLLLAVVGQHIIPFLNYADSVRKLKAFRFGSGPAILKFHINLTLNNVLFKIVCILLTIASRHP